MSRAQAFIMLVLVSVMMTRCTVDNGTGIAGVQDFPNSLASMGALAIKMIGLSSNWNQFGSVASIDQFPDKFPVSSAGLTKRRAAAALEDTIRWDLGDTLEGVATRYVWYDDAFTTRRDTAIVRYDSLARDTIRENEIAVSLRGYTYSKIIGLRMYYWFSDNDSDGVFDMRVLRMNVTDADGSGNQAIVHDRPGPDSSFDSWADNVPSLIEYLLLSQGDTLTFDRLVDTDGDGNLWEGVDPLWRGYEYTRIEKGDSADPGIARFLLQAQGRIITATGQSFAEKFTIDKDFVNGSSERLWGGGYGPDSTCVSGDTAWLRMLFTFSEPDTMSRYSSFVKVLLSSNPLNTSDNKLLAFSADCALRHGVISAATLALDAESGSVPGLPAVGSFSMAASLRSSGNVSLKGTAGVSLEGQYTDDTGRCYSAIWNGLGALINADECANEAPGQQ